MLDAKFLTLAVSANIILGYKGKPGTVFTTLHFLQNFGHNKLEYYITLGRSGSTWTKTLAYRHRW